MRFRKAEGKLPVVRKPIICLQIKKGKAGRVWESYSVGGWVVGGEKRGRFVRERERGGVGEDGETECVDGEERGNEYSVG